MDYTVLGILPARILERVAIPFSSGSSQPRDWTQVSELQADFLADEPQGKPKKERYTQLNVEFNRIARRDKKAFLSEQCIEIEGKK